MKFLVTGATGFLGWRACALLAGAGHEVVPVTRPGARTRAASAELEPVRIDAGDHAVRELLPGCDAVLHFAGEPSPAGARDDPARAVRENAGTTVNLLEGCAEHGAGLIYPSSVRAAQDPPPDPYAMSKRLGEHACRLHPARATVVRLTSVFGPGQVAWEGATGAIAAFAARAIDEEAIVIPGDPRRTRDFLYVDDLVPALAQIVAVGRWDQTLTLGSGVNTPLIAAAELVVEAVGSRSPIETPGGDLAPGENESYDTGAALNFDVRPLDSAVRSYVDWLRRHPAAQGRARA
ncbi:MAG TPA: NAD(P)-dependent oxidoreductase [Candidatus Limnocylindria bacterium]|jgi:UDP-glucose 4-epimerase|nr:NAD(P)-dependent oxidoreductase [Candidatus Limnocylindria bacterium]